VIVLIFSLLFEVVLLSKLLPFWAHQSALIWKPVFTRWQYTFAIIFEDSSETCWVFL